MSKNWKRGSKDLLEEHKTLKLNLTKLVKLPCHSLQKEYLLQKTSFWSSVLVLLFEPPLYDNQEPLI